MLAKKCPVATFVNAGVPGPVATDLFRHGKSKEQTQTLAKMTPLERLAQLEDVSPVISSLVGPDSAWIIGQILHGGRGHRSTRGGLQLAAGPDGLGNVCRLGGILKLPPDLV